MSKFIKILAYFVVFLIVAIFSSIIYLSNHFSTPSGGNISLRGLSGSVSIYRDEFGVPHINAVTGDEDAFFALGFVHAQDRFWQMEFQRRVVTGTLSEIFGRKTLVMDKYLRTYGFYKAAESSWSAFDKKTQSYITSYTAGVNAYINQGHYPLEIQLLHYQPKQWTVIDSIAWQKMMGWNLQNHSWMNKITYALAQINFGNHAINEYFPDYPSHAPVILADQNRLMQKSLTSIVNDDNLVRKKLNLSSNSGLGSNGWVVSGKKSTTGKPILANDIHLTLTAPNVWYLVELRGPTLHVTGATIPGMPAVAIGHNDKIAWGVTNGYNDAAELYVLNAQDKVTIQDDVIKIKGENNINHQILRSKFGPVINHVTPELKLFSQNIALKWPALMSNDTTVQSFIKINYATDWRKFQTALRDFVAPTQNFLYADTSGNIGFYYPGSLPVRRWKSLTPVDTGSRYQWHGFIPFEQLPHTYNPASEFIATANNKVTTDKYPYSINARWPVPPYRIDRIVNLIQQKHLLSIDDMTRIQADVKSEFWLKLRPTLLAVKPLDASSKTAISILQSWSGEMSTDNAAPTIFSYWLNSFNDLSPEILHQQGKTIDPLFLEQKLQKGTLSHYLRTSLNHAMIALVRDHGDNPENWQWGKIHHAVFVSNGFGQVAYLNKIWNRSIESPGGNYTVNVGGYDPVTLNQNKGATYRQVLDLSNFDNSLYIIPMGQSANLFSRHYSDLLAKWKNVQYIKIKSMPACYQQNKECLILNPTA